MFKSVSILVQSATLLQTSHWVTWKQLLYSWTRARTYKFTIQQIWVVLAASKQSNQYIDCNQWVQWLYNVWSCQMWTISVQSYSLSDYHNEHCVYQTGSQFVTTIIQRLFNDYLFQSKIVTARYIQMFHFMFHSI